ncbi:MAG: FtsQ-type POTRA domain-containing protein [Peptococcaceae bacterium]|jgi:cell division protein FtsQ|nr:FtsQ-type POTRA domain-containing protein [Peptococcaceae bacterium]
MQEPKKSHSGYIYLAALLILMVLGTSVFISRSGIFAVQNIIVQGNRQVSENEILRLAEYFKGKNLILADQEELRRKVMLQPLLSQVDLQKRLPDTLVIQVTERAAIALVLAPKGVIEVDKQGVFLRRLEGWPKTDFPVINGISVADTAGPGQIMDDQGLQLALRVLSEGPSDLTPLLAELYVDPVQQLRVFLTSGVEVRLGDAQTAPAKLNALLELLQDDSYLTIEQNVRYIDFTASKPVIG